ncbi:MAG TPA: hypothetical protein VFV67_14270 [Actinophytocola sp.]|nr:hypothetical protein [Actinophytocola sp.]HEU5471812.1 hypothetical protein [Actinophytocola sp.]
MSGSATAVPAGPEEQRSREERAASSARREAGTRAVARERTVNTVTFIK